ncbi:hypothetical protein [Streptomyces sp. NPDC002032]|uniref:hypothetical protein n=1 Tax=Streptomyces sp. NPDC002032 TaxID=3364630 RepID=UPI0036C5D9AC
MEEFTLAPARREAKAAVGKLEERAQAQKAVRVLAEAGLLPGHGAPEAIRETIQQWVREDGRRGTATWSNSPSNSLTLNPVAGLLAYRPGEARVHQRDRPQGRRDTGAPPGG